MVNFSLEGKVAWVTGASYGIGFALATAFSEAGAKIVFNDISRELVDKGLAAYKELGIEARGYVCDVTSEEQVNALVAQIEKEVGVVDILVNNAGIIKRIPMCEMTAEQFRQVIDVDLNAPFIVSKAVIPSMIKKGHGKIINICSMMSELGRETVSAYAAAKGGLKMLTRNIASEYGEFNIQCNGIGPGYIATPQTAPLREVQPDEVYNLGAMSHVAVSFESPEYTADVDAMGTLRLLEAIRFLGLEKKTRFYQASTSELYGLVQEIPQKETTPFYPRSPYAVAKLYAYWITVNYRESYGMYACNGILFNHESPRRGETFVTRKITRAIANIAQGLESCLYLGNMDSLRDWGHAKDYVKMQWMMLQQEQPEDFVIATGVQYSVRQFVEMAAAQLGIKLRFEGTGVEEKGIVVSVTGHDAPGVKPGDVIIAVDPRYFRPAEVETLLGDPTKAHEKLGWKPEITLREMVSEMVANDLEAAKKHSLLKSHGYDVAIALES